MVLFDEGWTGREREDGAWFGVVFRLFCLFLSCFCFGPLGFLQVKLNIGTILDAVTFSFLNQKTIFFLPKQSVSLSGYGDFLSFRDTLGGTSLPITAEDSGALGRREDLGMATKQFVEVDTFPVRSN